MSIIDVVKKLLGLAGADSATQAAVGGIMQSIAANIEQFRQTHGRLPHNTEAELLPLGFKHNKQGWQPNYIPHSNGYELRYQDGYTPPYLCRTSERQTWTTE